MIFAISKLFTALLLPPGLFATLAAVMAAFFKRARIPLLFLAATIYLLSIRPVGDGLLAPYEAPYRDLPIPGHADLVVSLGGGTNPIDPLFMNGETFKRHIYALELAKERNIPLVVTGFGSRHGFGDAVALQKAANRLHALMQPPPVAEHYVRTFVLIPETKSEDTYQNALFTRRLIPQKDPEIVLVTSAYHMKRSIRLFHLAGIRKIHPAAVNFYVKPDSYDWLDFLPSLSAFKNSYRALHEFFGNVKVDMRELVNGEQ